MTFDDYWKEYGSKGHAITSAAIAEAAWKAAKEDSAQEEVRATVPAVNRLYAQEERDEAWADFKDRPEWLKTIEDNVHSAIEETETDIFEACMERHGKVCFTAGIEAAIGKSPDTIRRTYTDIRDGLKGLPKTFYPDLLKTLVEASVAAGVWQPGGVARFVARYEPEATPEIKRKGFLADMLNKKTEEIIAAIREQREEILVAFIAKYGFQPDDVEQVETRNGDDLSDGWVWTIRRKVTPEGYLTEETFEKLEDILTRFQNDLKREPEEAFAWRSAAINQIAKVQATAAPKPIPKNPGRPPRQWTITSEPEDCFQMAMIGPSVSVQEGKSGIPVREILPDFPEDCIHTEMMIDSSPGYGRTEFRGVCRKCNAAGYFMETEEDAGRAFRMLSAARILKEIMFRLQVELQPPGSPCPGGDLNLALWIIQSARERIEKHNG